MPYLVLSLNYGMQIGRTMSLNTHSSLIADRTLIITWCKPPPVWVKLNVDDSARENSDEGGGRGICKDHLSNLIFAFHNRYGPVSNIVAEARALADGLIQCRDRGFSQIMAETDSRVVFDAVTNPDKSGSWNIWEGNFVVDGLAKLASGGAPNKLYLIQDDLPRPIRGSILLDRSNFGSIRLVKPKTGIG
ncbi:uncharacterized protein LOC131233729 [Magnolia sinica]|uniref:uncharacterized protein LOC131233729 n=1 Tax=Magnolia sinica TaxID=86752 RepID=UPI00265878B0|nr:uncharacterized protein LOC131233729 [Magnolia sinica]